MKQLQRTHTCVFGAALQNLVSRNSHTSWIKLPRDTVKCWVVTNASSVKGGQFLDCPRDA